MKKILCALALAAGFAMPSQAAITVTGGIAGAIVDHNDYKSDLNNLGYDTLVEGGMISFTEAGTVEFFFLGAESFYHDTFYASNGDDSVTYTEENRSVLPFNYPGVSFGSFDVEAGAFSNMYFEADMGGAGQIAPGHLSFGVMTMGYEDDRQLKLLDDYAYHGTFNEVIFAFDDDGVQADDDNHDDLLILARFTSAVPEPATWLMMIMGFGLVGVASRRRKAVANLA